LTIFFNGLPLMLFDSKGLFGQDDAIKAAFNQVKNFISKMESNTTEANGQLTELYCF